MSRPRWSTGTVRGTFVSADSTWFPDLDCRAYMMHVKVMIRGLHQGLF